MFHGSPRVLLHAGRGLNPKGQSWTQIKPKIACGTAGWGRMPAWTRRNSVLAITWAQEGFIPVAEDRPYPLLIGAGAALAF